MGKKRAEVDTKYQWDLTKIYKTEQEFEEDFKRVENLLFDISSYKGRLTSSASVLKEALDLLFEILRLEEKVSVFAYMKNDEDTSNTKSQERKGKVEQLDTSVSEAISFFDPELLQTDYEKILTYEKENSSLEEYHFVLEQIFRDQKHTLEESQEKLLSRLGNALSFSDKTASYLRNTDLRFQDIQDEKGNKVELTNGNYTKYMKSGERRVRREAFESLYQGYASFKNTFASTYNGHVTKCSELAHLRKFEHTIDMYLHSSHVPYTVYQTLIDTVHEHLDTLFSYYELKREVLNLDELHLYDLYADLIKGSNKSYSYEEAKELVLSSLSVLGEDYIQNISRAFDESWIDVFENEGKRSGAYSWGCYDSNPYILLNYQGTLDDVSTLAHELGHSMHSFYSKQNNPYPIANYKIFVAEVASTVNELLFYNYLLNHTQDKEEKLTILNEMMDLFKSTIYRQTMFAEFEKEIFDSYEKGTILTHKNVSDLYYSLNKIYFGDKVIVDELIRFEWMRIPHFYTPFYVYQYATGLSAACYIAQNILKGDQRFIENYKNFLKTGGRDYPINELKIAGVDITDKNVIESALSTFQKTIEEFKSLYYS